MSDDKQSANHKGYWQRGVLSLSVNEENGIKTQTQLYCNDHKAAALYRAMFVNDKDINKLDFNYANSTFPVKSLESSKELPIFAS